MNKEKDPMGAAIADYYKTDGRTTGKLRVFSPMFDEDEIPLETLFREYDEMPVLEQKALQLANGRILDVGAGAGCHTLALQDMGKQATAIDISELSVETMQKRGVEHAVLQDFWKVEEKYDTILMLMNGIGIIGTLKKLPDFFAQIDKILADGGQVLLDSSDICYVFEVEDDIIEIPSHMDYYGELSYQMQYKRIKGEEFPWLYIDPDLLQEEAEKHGFTAEVVEYGEHYDFLAKIERKKE
ncbi:MAG: class I SAM-dependent methyltransferase [Bacteroidaceae bacterium]|nr:class I SAM-dependent methyltransferase [Bacteroidaceae bacterium]